MEVGGAKWEWHVCAPGEIPPAYYDDIFSAAHFDDIPQISAALPCVALVGGARWHVCGEISASTYFDDISRHLPFEASHHLRFMLHDGIAL